METIADPPNHPIARSRHVVSIVLLTWWAMVGFDFFLHAGVLARFYALPSPFLLPPERAFQRIPLGYLSFLLLAGLLVWLVLRLQIRGGRPGALFGLQLGGLVWGALVLGLLSVSTASSWLLLGWFVGQTLELALAGYTAGSALHAQRLGPLWGKVTVLVCLFVVMTIILQTVGGAPAVRT